MQHIFYLYSLQSLINNSLFSGPDSSAHGVKFTDHKVCKSFLYGCCPHEILASTVRIPSFLENVYFCALKQIMCLMLQRMDLGECPKIHELALRADYQQASKTKDYFYDVEVRKTVLQVLKSISFTFVF